MPLSKIKGVANDLFMFSLHANQRVSQPLPFHLKKKRKERRERERGIRKSVIF